MKFKWTKYCLLSVTGNESNINENDTSNNILFTIKDTKLHVLVVTLSAKDNKKLLIPLSKGL